MTNKAKRIFVGITVLGMAFSLLPVGIIFPAYSTAEATGSCTLASASGRTLIYFNEHIRADWNQADATAGPLGTFIPAGIYRVTLVSFDDHWAKPNQTDQTQERWFIGLQNSGGSTFANTPSINDLPDNINTLTQVVVSEFTVSQDASAVFARHTAFPGSNADSITAVCAAFDFVRDIDNGSLDEPDVNTNSPTGVDENSANLRGETRPNGDDTNAWFEWGTNPSNLTNTTPVKNVGDGSSFVDFSSELTNLNDDTVYHYRAVANNDNGTVYGSIVSFTTDSDGGNSNSGEDEPDATTLSARDIEEDEARLRGEVDPNDLDTEVWFEWGTSRFNLNEDTNRQDVDGDESLESFDYIIDDLDEDEKYYFRAVAENSEGIDRGSVFSFTTDDNGSGGDKPDIRDVDVENIDDDRARLVCTVDANGYSTDVWFEWDEDEDDVDDGDGEETRRVSVSRSHTRRDVKVTITGLDEDTRYFFRCVARNSEGTDRSRVEDFRTDDNGRRNRDDEPEVTTRSATNIGQTSAVLRGEVDPNGEDTDAWFQWGTSRSNLNNSSREEDMGDGTREEDFNRRITGLRSNTLYYFRAVAESREGIDRGSTLSFRTDRGATPFVPVTTTRTASPITRVVEVFRDRFSSREEGLIITLDADTSKIDRGEIEYEISYDNRTDDTFTSAELIIEIPDELKFVDASPREDSERNDEIIFKIGTIRPGDDDSFIVETDVRSRVDNNDEIVFKANVEYIDDDDKKIITVIDVTTIGEARPGGFMALFAGNLAGFFTNPFLWLIILLVVIFFVYRYFASLAKPRERSEFLDDALQPPLPQDNGL